MKAINKGVSTMKTLINLLIIVAFVALVIIFSGCEYITEPTENASVNKTTTQTLEKVNPERPFKGNILYSITGANNDNTIWYLTGTGNLTHLGKCTTVETIYFLEGRGEDTFTAADGSQLNMTWYSVGEDEVTTTFKWTIIGGTGRFAKASGSGVCPPVFVNSDGTFIIEFIGVIKY
jgi:hypothetical protein